MNPGDESLEEKLQRFESPVAMMRAAAGGGYPFPIPAEFTNWRDEQRAWNEGVALLDLSHHMTDIYVEGPDTVRLLSDLMVNSFEGFGEGCAKQVVACNNDGYVIGDAILFGLASNKVNITGRPTVGHWVAFQAERGDYDVTITIDERSVDNPGERLTFRYQITGPDTMSLLAMLGAHDLESVPVFRICEVTIAGVPVRALNHSMARSVGFELFGPREYAEHVRSAILEAGEPLGIRACGARAYSTISPESGWYASPTPAIYSGPDLRAYREWLRGDSWEGNLSMSGSFVSDRIEDYYHRPDELGYGHLVKFDHDFLGADALKAASAEPRRRKVWLRWFTEDVLRVLRNLCESGDRFKFIEIPSAYYSSLPFDQVLAGDRFVGLSQYPVYTANARCWFSLGLIDENVACDDAQVTVVWGEGINDAVSNRIGEHVQIEIRAAVCTTSPGR